MRACPDWTSLGPQLPDLEEQSPTEFQALEAHLQQCPTCQQTFEGLLRDEETAAWQQLGQALTPTATQSNLGTDAGGRDLDSAPRYPFGPPGQAGHLGTLGEYQVVALLGRGAMGAVFKAYDPGLRRVVALKIPRPELGERAEYRQRFEREARSAAAVQHPHVVATFHVAQATPDFPLPYLVLEYVEGEPLSDRLKRESVLSPRAAAEIARQVAVGLAAAHAQGLVHRDIKPSNILLDQKTGLARLSDFGLARTAEGSQQFTHVGCPVGTPSYMSPEQIQFPSQVDGRCDVFSMGITLFEMLTGECPFRGTTSDVILQQIVHEDPQPPRRLNAAVPRDLETICLKCLRKEPGKRYATALDLAEDVRRFLAGEPIAARPVGPAEMALKWVRRRPAAAVLIAVSAAAVLALLIGGLVYNYNLQLAYELVDQTQQKADKTNQQANAFHAAARQAYDDAKNLQATARSDKVTAAKALLDARHIIYALQLREVGSAVDARDYSQGLALLEDTDRCPAVLRDFTWGYYYRWCKRDRLTLLVGVGSSLAVSPDGSTIAVPTSAGVQLYDVGSGRHQTSLHGNGTNVASVAFSPDGRTLAAVVDQTVTLWDLTTHQVKTSLPRCTAPVLCLAFSPDGTTLAAGCGMLGRPGVVQVWDVPTNKELPPCAGSADAILSVAFARDGKMLATGAADGEVKLWNLATGQACARLPAHPSHHVKAVAFGPDRKTLATGGADGLVKLWALDDKQCRLTLQGFAAGVNGLAYTHDGSVAACYDNACVKIWDVAAARERNTLRGHKNRVRAVAFTPDGRAVISRSDDGTVKLWNTDLACEPTTVPEARGTCLAIADDRTIAFVAENRLIQLWDVAAGKAQAVFPGTLRWTTAITCAPGGKLLAWGSSDGTLRLRDMDSDKESKTLFAHTKEINALAFAPGGRTVASASRDRLVKLWNVQTGKCTATLAGQGSEVRAVAFAPDGKVLAWCDGDLHVWDGVDAHQRVTRREFRGFLYAVAYHPDGKTLATAGDDAAITLWDAETVTKRAVLTGHDGPVRCLAYSPDGQILASAGLDNTILLWDSATLKQVAALRGHKGPITALGFTPDGKLLASASLDKTLKLWQARPV